jgi:argininosuccinate lyase
MPHKKNPDVFELIRGNATKFKPYPTKSLTYEQLA